MSSNVVRLYTLGPALQTQSVQLSKLWSRNTFSGVSASSTFSSSGHAACVRAGAEAEAGAGAGVPAGAGGGAGVAHDSTEGGRALVGECRRRGAAGEARAQGLPSRDSDAAGDAERFTPATYT